MRPMRPRRPSRWLALLVLPLLLGWPARPAGAQADPQDDLFLYFFWSNTCPHCAEAKPVLEVLQVQHPRLVVRDFELHDRENLEYFGEMAEMHGLLTQYTPTIVIGPYSWYGYDEHVGEEMVEVIEYCLARPEACPDAALGPIEAPESGIERAERPEGAADAPYSEAPPLPERNRYLDIPLVGRVDLSQHSLLYSTIIISFVDGVNPCSLWVLTMLLALVIHTGSRKKVLWIGLVFITVSAAIYALFIAGLFSILRVMAWMDSAQLIVALVAIFFASINIKDYFWFKEGVSLTIADKHKPGIYQKMRRVLAASDSMVGVTGATIVLATGVSLVEFSCTAGFPVLWTNLLTSQEASTATFVALLAIYMLIYQIDELAIFGTVVFTLRASRLQEKEGRILKLFSGILMLALGLVMLVDPGWMDSVSNTLSVFLFAASAAVIVLVVHRWVLPKFGIWIGTEERPAEKDG